MITERVVYISHLEALLETLTEGGLTLRVGETPFKFFESANEMLVIDV